MGAERERFVTRMRLLSLFVCYLFVMGCAERTAPTSEASQTDEPPPLQQPESPSSRSEPRSRPPVTEPEITITSVTASNPVIVEGRARTFENNVVVRVLDARGEMVRETFTTSQGESGQRNPFRSEVFVTRDPGSEITVQALEYSARDGSERSLVSKRVAYDVEPIDIDLYLHHEQRDGTDCSRVSPSRLEIPKSVAMARLLVEALISTAGSPFPRGSAVNSVLMRNGVVSVDFNERLQNVGGSCAAQAIRASVDRTLRQLPSVKRVIISAGGNEKLALQP